LSWISVAAEALRHWDFSRAHFAEEKVNTEKIHVEAITAINLMVWRRKSAQPLRRGTPVGRRLFHVSPRNLV
jgi:hypothetical protein